MTHFRLYKGKGIRKSVTTTTHVQRTFDNATAIAFVLYKIVEYFYAMFNNM